LIRANPGVAIQTAWMTDAGTVYYAGLPGAVFHRTCRWCRRCKAVCLHRPSRNGPSDDIGVGRQWTNQLPNPREAFGVGRQWTICRTQATHGVKHCSSGNGLRQMIEGGGSRATGRRALYGHRGLLPHDTQCLTHHEWHHNFISTAAPATDSGR
jgi:hypothetical protein